MKTLLLSVGHNWGANGKAIDKGASGNGTNEATEINFIIDGIIKVGIPGVKIVKVPLGLNLRQRIDWINTVYTKYPEPFAIEFHLDSGPSTAEGASVWYDDHNYFTQGEGIQFLQKYTEITGQFSRHVNSDTTNRHKQLGFVSEVKCASLLIELGFISNPKELKKIKNQALKGIIAGILNMNSK